MTEPMERIKRVEAQLHEMGIKTVKLSLSPSAEAVEPSCIINGAADFLEKFISRVSAVDVSVAGDMPATQS